MHVVLAGGGTAGHIEPALATADALRRRDPNIGITCLGTQRGLETRLVPERGYDLALVPPVPLPRKVNMDLLRVPVRERQAVRETKAVLDRTGAAVVAGFGGYVALPAYLAARSSRIPVVVHEANVRPGLANKLGARWAKSVAISFPGTPLRGAQLVGIPLRRSITTLDRAALRAEGRAFFDLEADRPTVLVFGGSQGALTLNRAFSGAAGALATAGVQVLHAHGPRQSVTIEQHSGSPPYVTVPYIDRMDLAYAAADLVVCRSGAMTCAEMSAIGLPAIYVPLPIGNGEQRLNAQPTVTAGGGLLVDDAACTADWIAAHVPPLVTDPRRLEAMSAAATSLGHRSADEAMADLVLSAAGR